VPTFARRGEAPPPSSSTLRVADASSLASRTLQLLGPKDLAAEALLLGLRTTAGIELDGFKARYGFDLSLPNRTLHGPRPRQDTGAILGSAAEGVMGSRRQQSVPVLGWALVALGVLVWIPAFVLPAMHSLASLAWTETECTILESRVAAYAGSANRTRHRIEILYSYEVAGIAYQSSRYHFYPYGVSGRGQSHARQQILDSLPPGTRTTCWVDLKHPSEAVIERSLGWTEGCFRCCVPLVFVAVGVYLARRRA
jgi:Protein of unknown function (DUF3592)